MRWVGRAGYEEIVRGIWDSEHEERIEGGCRAAICDKLGVDFCYLEFGSGMLFKKSMKKYEYVSINWMNKIVILAI